MLSLIKTKKVCKITHMYSGTPIELPFIEADNLKTCPIPAKPPSPPKKLRRFNKTATKSNKKQPPVKKVSSDCDIPLKTSQTRSPSTKSTKPSTNRKKSKPSIPSVLSDNDKPVKKTQTRSPSTKSTKPSTSGKKAEPSIL